MKSRTERGTRTQGENAAVAQLTNLVEPMLAGMAATRENLMAWVQRIGDIKGLLGTGPRAGAARG